MCQQCCNSSEWVVSNLKERTQYPDLWIQWMHMVSHYKCIWWPFPNTRWMCFRSRNCCLTMHWQLLDTSMSWTIPRDVPLLFIILQVWTFILHYSLYIIYYTVSCINFVGRILVSINNYTMTWSSINLYPQSL